MKNATLLLALLFCASALADRPIRLDGRKLRAFQSAYAFILRTDPKPRLETLQVEIGEEAGVYAVEFHRKAAESGRERPKGFDPFRSGVTVIVSKKDFRAIRAEVGQ